MTSETTQADGAFTLIDCEFYFAAGLPPLFVVVDKRRDVIEVDAERIRLELRPNPETTEEFVVHRSALAYMHITYRLATDDPQHPEVAH